MQRLLKKIICAAGIMMLALSMRAAAPDSVFVKPDIENGTRNFQIAYSIDGRHW